MSTEPLNVIHVTSWLTRAGGGIPPVIMALAREAQQLGAHPTVAGLKDAHFETDCSGKPFPIIGGAIVGPRAFGFSPELKSALSQMSGSNSVFHSHGVWMYPTWLARQCAEKTGAPLMITPHGMLEPWALQLSRMKKTIASRLFEARNLRQARCLHALCLPEAQNLRAYGLKNPIALIPNGVDIELFQTLPERDAICELCPQAKNRKRILFLSRIHPKKGIPNLLEAWRALHARFPDWCILIAGPEEVGHEQELKEQAGKLGISDSVFFLGPLYGAQKMAAFAGADIFALPSHSEGFSMAILEACAAGLPVLMTQPCNFSELAAAGGALEVDPTASDVERGLLTFLTLSNEDRIRMGTRAKNLSRSYSWPAITKKMLSVYRWMLGREEAPDCILSNS